MFELAKLYSRRQDIHEIFGGQQQGGIATPAKAPYVFLFTGEAGEQHGYHDGYDDNGLFIYTGEGQQGDMQFVRGNRAIRNHIKDGKELMLFSATKKKGIYRFNGPFICAGYDAESTGLDTNGHLRRLIKFHLAPATGLSTQDEYPDLPYLQDKSIEELRACAYEAGKNQTGTSPSTSKRNLYKRSIEVKTYVLARAKGLCEACEKMAPFLRKNEQPYLEVHHIRQLSDDGLDIPLWTAAICPTCHREIHHGKEGKIKNQSLQTHINTLENLQNI